MYMVNSLLIETYRKQYEKQLNEILNCLKKNTLKPEEAQEAQYAACGLKNTIYVLDEILKCEKDVEII